MAAATDLALRKKLAQKAYARTAAYDAAISNWLAQAIGEDDARLSALSAASSSEADALWRESASRRPGFT